MSDRDKQHVERHDHEVCRFDAKWFRSVLDAIDDLVLVKGDRSKLLWANRAFRDVYGMSNEQLAEIVDAEHSDPDDTLQYVKDDRFVFQSGETLRIPSEAITDASGSVSYHETVKSPIKHDDGTVWGTVGVSRAIDDPEVVFRSSQAREGQKASMRELRSLVSTLPLAVVMLDARQRILCQSSAWVTLLDYHGPSLAGRFYDDIFGSQLSLFSPVAQVIETGDSYEIRANEIQRYSREAFVGDVFIQPWFLTNQEIGGALVLVHDVTELHDSQRRLRQANEELAQFNYRVSHDLVAPLRTLKGYLNICADELGEQFPAVHELHLKMIDRVDQLSDLVRDVVNLAKSDLRDDTLEPVAIEPIIDDVLAGHSDTIEKSGVSIKRELEVASLASVEFRVRQILENLISNAIKYSDPAQAMRQITIGSSQRGDRVVLMVQDNGIGVPDEVRSSLFDIFVRGGAEHPGHGLGLYLVRKHAERLGGNASLLDTHPTTFEVSLPIRERV